MSWYVEVRNTSRPRYSKHVERGGEVTVRIDPERYAQARLAKIVAQATREGRTLSEPVKARILATCKAEALEKNNA